MRYLLVLLALSACGGSASTSPSPPRPRPAAARPVVHEKTGLGCYIDDATAAAACNARVAEGCAMQAPMHCQGTEPTREQLEAWQRASEEESQPCQCVCEADRRLCMQAC